MLAVCRGIKMKYDRIIIGAGIYGLYAALYCAKKNMKVLVLEIEKEAFSRATFINQARVHMGYHYPRSLYTAKKSAGYFNRFNEDYGFCINSAFKQIYATSADFSWTSANEFKHFCNNAGIMCEEIPVSTYFKDNMCDGAFCTKEYTYDAMILKDYFLKELDKYSSVEIMYETEIKKIYRNRDEYVIKTDTQEYSSEYVLNATYASVNQIHEKAGFAPFKIKYELCEIVLCNVGEALKKVGITVMDGPFFSIMPFGKTGLHSLTTVTRTPHETCYDRLPGFSCQDGEFCSDIKLGNCDLCRNKPKSSFKYMESLAHKYLKEKYEFEFQSSRYSMKPILKASEVDDSRPTMIRVINEKTYFISVLSGKINTVYDLDEYLEL